MRDATGEDGVGDARPRKDVVAAEDRLFAEGARPLAGIILGHEAENHGHALTREAVGDDPRILESVPGHLDHQALLRLHPDRVSGREPVGGRVEELRMLQEATETGADLAGDTRAGIVEIVDVVAELDAVLGHLPNRIATRSDDLPEFLGAPGVGVTTADADDRDRPARGQLLLAAG